MAGVIPKHHVQIASNLYVNTSCLNEDENAPHNNVLSDCDERFCSSDADEQLLFRLPFKTAVKLSALKIQCPSVESAPTSIKLFINTTEMGFDDAEEKKATEVLSLDPETLTSGVTIPLTFVRYQFVDNISVFVAENNGDDVTSISYLGFLGEPVASMDMSEFKAQG
eukprot:g7838.t1